MSTRSKIAAGVVIAFLILVFLGWFWIAHISNGFSARAEPSPMEASVATLVRRMAVPSKAKVVRNPVSYSEAVFDEARAHWADHCAFCHANNGSGDSEVGRNLYPKAPDMRKERTQSMTDGEIYYTIKNGVRLTGMPAWGEPGDRDEDSWKLVYFIRHLPKMTDAEAEQMKQMNPQSPMEMNEEKEEEQFLEGSSPKSSSPHNMHSQRKEQK